MRWIVLGLLLAGCLGPSMDEPGPASPEPAPAPTTPPPRSAPSDLPLLLAFDYRGCQGQSTQLELPASTIQETLPEGYAAWTTDGLRPAGVAEYLWVRCQTFAHAQVTVNDTAYGHVAVRVEGSGQGEHWYRLRMLTADDLMEAVWTAAAYQVYRGEYTHAADPVPSIAVGEYVIDAIGTAEEQTTSRQVTYHTKLDDGRLEWRGEIEVDALTAFGRMQVPSDDALADAIPPLVSSRFVSGDFVRNDLWLLRS